MISGYYHATSLGGHNMPLVDGSKCRRNNDKWLKRQALQIVVQLPDDPGEARAVLDYARSLVREYLGEDRVSDQGAVISRLRPSAKP